MKMNFKSCICAICVKSLMVYFVVLPSLGNTALSQKQSEIFHTCGPVNCQVAKDKTIIRIIPFGNNNDSVLTELNVPIYTFKSDKTGLFFKGLCDSIAKYDYMSVRELTPMIYENTPITTVSSIYLTNDIIKRIKGVIIQGKTKIIILTDLDSDWIDSVGLTGSHKKATIKIESRPSDCFIMEGDDNYYFCVIQVLPTGKLIIPTLSVAGIDLIKNQKIRARRFKWIDQFNRKNGFPLYYDIY